MGRRFGFFGPKKSLSQSRIWKNKVACVVVSAALGAATGGAGAVIMGGEAAAAAVAGAAASGAAAAAAPKPRLTVQYDSKVHEAVSRELGEDKQSNLPPPSAPAAAAAAANLPAPSVPRFVSSVGYQPSVSLIRNAWSELPVGAQVEVDTYWRDNAAAIRRWAADTPRTKSDAQRLLEREQQQQPQSHVRNQLVRAIEQFDRRALEPATTFTNYAVTASVAAKLAAGDTEGAQSQTREWVLTEVILTGLLRLGARTQLFLSLFLTCEPLE